MTPQGSSEESLPNAGWSLRRVGRDQFELTNGTGSAARQVSVHGSAGDGQDERLCVARRLDDGESLRFTFDPLGTVSVSWVDDRSHIQKSTPVAH